MPGDDPTAAPTGTVDYDDVEPVTAARPVDAAEPGEPLDEQETWLEDEAEELPPRPRRRVLAPIPLALLGALLIACGFIAGVEVQKGQGGSTGGAGGSGLAARFAALRGGTSAGGGTGGGGSGAPAGSVTAPRGAGAGGSAGAGGGSGAGGGVTTGEVAYVRGNTLYVTTSEGSTVKVTAAAGSKVTKTVTTKASRIHPGTTVVVLGSQAKDGSISASSISVGAGTFGGTLGFGGSGAAGTSSSGAGGGGKSSSGAGGSGATPQLFGSG